MEVDDEDKVKSIVAARRAVKQQQKEVMFIIFNFIISLTISCF
jgi:hypothetical protein